MPNPDAVPPLPVPCLPTLFQEELARAGALPGHAAAAETLWPRFAGFYRGLARLPRKMRRALQRRWRRSLGGIALLLALGQAPALAATIFVDGTTCTLVDAITAANSDAATGGCTAGSGADTIALMPGSTHALTDVNGFTYGFTGLPVIASEITIDGGFPRSTITRDDTAPPFGILAVGADGNLTLLETTVTGGFQFLAGGGIYNRGMLTLRGLSTVSGNTAGNGGGIDNAGTTVLESSTVSANTAEGLGGGIENRGTLTLNFSTVSGNTALQITVSGQTAGGLGGGIDNALNSTLTLTASSVTGNSADVYGGGISSAGTLNLRFSTVSGNTAGSYGGGVGSGSLITVTNSTVSGNSVGDRGGGVNSTGTLTLTNSTISGNVSGRVGGGLFNFNTGTATLVQSLLSGNSAPVIGQEAYNASGTVIGDSFNLFGHDGFSGVTGFTLGATDLVPAVPLPAILDPMLSNNGGPTQTHGLVFGSPAVDAIPGAGCATAIDQRGAPRPQDADGDTVPDCDIGAVERGLVPIQAEILSTTLDCRATGCQVSVRCNLLEAECRNPIDITIRGAP